MQESGLIIHLVQNPVFAKRFVEPLVNTLLQAGYHAELWIDPSIGPAKFLSVISCSVKLVKFQLVANPFSLLSRFLRLRRELRVSEPVCIHAHTTRGAFLPLLIGYLQRTPVRIYHNHGSAYWGTRGISKIAFGLLEGFLCKLATHVVIVSPLLKDVFVKDGLAKAEDCHVVGPGSVCGINLKTYSPWRPEDGDKTKLRKERGISPDDFVVLYVGRPYRRKGFHFFLRAWRNSSFCAPGNTLLIAGCTEEDLRKVLGSEPPPQIKALGYQTEMRRIYACADVVTLPSEHEGMPYSLLEGAACGKPLLATDIPGVRMILSPGVEGLTFPVGNRAALLECLSRLKNDQDMRHVYGR